MDYETENKIIPFQSADTSAALRTTRQVNTDHFGILHDRASPLPTGRQARRMKIDSISPLPLRGGRGRVGVNIQILSPLTSFLSHQGERRYFVGLFAE